MNNLYALLLFCFLLITSCDTKGQESHITKPDNAPLTYLALGDSYTIGHKVDEDERWPNQLAVALRDFGIAVQDPKIIAETDWTTVELRDAIEKADLATTYDVVSLLIGVNDQYDGLNFDDYPNRFRFLLKKAITLAGGRADHVFVVSIPDYSVTPFGQHRNPEQIHQELKKYNSTNEWIAERFNVHYVNITPESRNAADNLDLVASDGLHPSGQMYAEWVDLITPVVLPEIQSWPIVQP